MKLMLHPCTGRRSPQLLNPFYSVEVFNDKGQHVGCWNVKAKSNDATLSYKVHLIMTALPKMEL